MLDHVLELASDPALENELRVAVDAHTEQVLATAEGGDRSMLRAVEHEVSANPAAAIRFDGRGTATLSALGQTWAAGRFEIPMLWTLRARASRDAEAGRWRLFVLTGDAPTTDIGALQAFAPQDRGGTLFQVASQFNCLESPGPYVTPVANYLHDPTQGPRASVSAFPGTFIRHYAAPSTDGRRFTQHSDDEQIDLLGDVFPVDVARVRNGYLRDSYVRDPEALAEALEQRFDAIRVGLHDDVDVVLGYHWDGAVPGPRRVAQVFTSTLAAGGYSRVTPHAGVYHAICRQLLRGAYLGTLYAARATKRRLAVLTLIGGGVFGNPIPLIWESIVWAFDEAMRDAQGNLDVVLNGRNLCDAVPIETLVEGARARSGAVLELTRHSTIVHR